MSTPAELQELLDAIPLHTAHRLRLTTSSDGLRIDGLLGAESSRGRGYDQAHGGVVAALLDTAATFALMAATGGPASTVDLRIDYLRPVPLGEVVLLAAPVRVGRTVSRARAELIDSEGRQCATAIGTFVI